MQKLTQWLLVDLNIEHRKKGSCAGNRVGLRLPDVCYQLIDMYCVKRGVGRAGREGGKCESTLRSLSSASEFT